MRWAAAAERVTLLHPLPSSIPALTCGRLLPQERSQARKRSSAHPCCMPGSHLLSGGRCRRRRRRWAVETRGDPLLCLSSPSRIRHMLRRCWGWSSGRRGGLNTSRTGGALPSPRQRWSNHCMFHQQSSSSRAGGIPLTAWRGSPEQRGDHQTGEGTPGWQRRRRRRQRQGRRSVLTPRFQACTHHKSADQCRDERQSKRAHCSQVLGCGADRAAAARPAGSGHVWPPHAQRGTPRSQLRASSASAAAARLAPPPWRCSLVEEASSSAPGRLLQSERITTARPGSSIECWKNKQVLHRQETRAGRAGRGCGRGHDRPCRKLGLDGPRGSRKALGRCCCGRLLLLLGAAAAAALAAPGQLVAALQDIGLHLLEPVGWGGG